LPDIFLYKTTGLHKYPISSLGLLLLFFCLFDSSEVKSQKDTGFLKSIYDHCLNIPEEKCDSLYYYSLYIDSIAKEIGYKKGKLLSTRILGMYLEFHYDYEGAISSFLQTLTESRKLKDINYEICALGDLAFTNLNMKKLQVAKDYYLQSASLVKKTNNPSLTASVYNNVGAIYSQIGNYDSSLIYLNKSLSIYKTLSPKENMDELYNNLAVALLNKKEFPKAYEYLFKNYTNHLTSNAGDGTRWLDHLNLADYFYKKNDFNKALKYADSAYFLANRVNSLPHKSDCLELLEKIHFARKDYERAYKAIADWRKIDTALHSLSISLKVEELRENFHAQQQLEKNKTLEMELIANKTKSNLSTTVAIVLFLLVIIAIAVIVIIKYNQLHQSLKNKQILEQNTKLIQMSEEQNQLVSFVAHDLNLPFTTIDVWTRIAMESDPETDKQYNLYLQKIEKASSNGQSMIRKLLDLEKNLHQTSFKPNKVKWQLSEILHNSLENLSVIAKQKEIELKLNIPKKGIKLETDAELLSRLFENLVTNAIKFSYRKSKVLIHIEENNYHIKMQIQDFGVGIKKDELPFLFLKFKRISSIATEGEASSGLGLVVANKIVEVLNGSIFCESDLGKGSCFTIILPKY